MVEPPPKFRRMRLPLPAFVRGSLALVLIVANTLVWCGLFAVNMTFIAAFALTGREDAWTWYAGAFSYLLMAAFQGLEFVVRKVWFRHYGRGPLDRVFARLFPSENTPTGRRSLAYIQKMRARIMRGEER